MLARFRRSRATPRQRDFFARCLALGLTLLGCAVDDLPGTRAVGGAGGESGMAKGGSENGTLGGTVGANAGAAGASDAGSAGVQGGGGAVQTCLPEACNGLNDDCDATTDEQCPVEGTPLKWSSANIFTEYV